MAAREAELKRIVVFCAGLAAVSLLPANAASASTDWPTYGHDPGGMRYSPLRQITRDNVSSLKPAWVYHMKPADAVVDANGPGGLSFPGATPPGGANNESADAAQRRAEGVGPSRWGGNNRFAPSEATPLVVGGTMYLTTPYHRVVALSPQTGAQIWSYEVAGPGQPSIRGVEYWPGDKQSPPEILFGTRDGRLIALDAKTGAPIASFGDKGVVNLRTPEIMNDYPKAIYGLTSPPIVYRDLVITGVANQEFPALGSYGDVRAWNVKTGKLVWTFHSVARPGEYGHDTWAGDSWKNRSGVNVWGFMTVDAKRGIVYMPFGAPSWDRYGGDRLGKNLFSDSIVAADANTGKMLWHFQVVRHDIWDFDTEAPPVLIDVQRGKKTIPAVAVVSKSALLFILNRVTGKPIYPVVERPVPPSDVPGEQAWPTQPFPVVTPPLARQTMTVADIATVTPELETYCRKLIEDNQLLLGGPYLPTGFNRSTVNFPGTQGGANWGGGSFDPKLGYLFVNSNDMGQIQSRVSTPGQALPFGQGRPFGRFMDPTSRMMCQQPPWGRLSAVDVNTGKLVWQVPLGVTDSLPAEKQATGRPNLGGSIVTASGLVFIGATDDSRFRAFDADTGKELWTAKLEASAHATPITYEGPDGKQYVVITSTGGGFLESPLTSDTVTAFTLP
ncbi:MAG: pyrroloquinoline quinone-dependent dehydrogenase [Alphaproteobacteria bacterium]|nr:pyrroloquinoline quinone-dependent dehydrogenase [Alphaproteobacteria bacterium]